MYTNQHDKYTSWGYITTILDIWPINKICIAKLWQHRKFYFAIALPQWNQGVDLIFLDIGLKKGHIRLCFSILGFGGGFVWYKNPRTMPKEPNK